MNLQAESGIRIAPHGSSATVDALRAVVGQGLSDSVENYCAWPVEQYRELVHDTQARLSDADFMRRIAGEILPQLQDYLGGDTFLVQTNLYLRAARPFVAQSTETIDWHRETFYGLNMERSINIWTPVSGVDITNTLQFIPGSQDIPDEDIVVESIQDGVTQRYSTGHKIGFVYAPKKIVSGVDLGLAQPMLVPDGTSSIFPGNLIHGAGANRSKQIRFSVDFRIIPKKAWKPQLAKDFHFASGKPYFEEY